MLLFPGESQSAAWQHSPLLFDYKGMILWYNQNIPTALVCGRVLFFQPCAFADAWAAMRGRAVWQLTGLITRRPQVQILPPLLVSGFIPHDIFQIQLGHPRDRVSFCYLPLDLNKHMFYTLVTKRRYGRIFVRFVELGGGYLYILSIRHVV